MGPDPTAGAAARDEAMARVEAHAPREWKDEALDAVQHVADDLGEFTTSQVWVVLRRPPEGRALGPIMKKAEKLGIIEATDRFVPDPRRHMTPTRVWRKKR